MPAGVVAAGHPLTAHAGADVLRAGGNAVDAAVGAMLTSVVAESLLTGLGAGGYMLVAGAGRDPVLLDFFVEAPGRRAAPEDRASLTAFSISFGDAVQVFNAGPASCGTYGVPAGVARATELWGSRSLEELAAPAAALAREGVTVNEQQGYVAEILQEILLSTPECAALWAPDGRVLAVGDTWRNPELGDALELLGREGAHPFYEGAVAGAVCSWLGARGGIITSADLREYRAIERAPVRVAYRGREVLTNPPPSAGGTLLSYSLALLARSDGPPSLSEIVEAMEAAQAERTPEFLEGLADEGFLERFLAAHLGSTTHIAVLDGAGLACSVTTTNGSCSGVVVPGTGLHLNNIMGEEDLNPLGFHRYPPGRRLPSMMAPTVVLRDGAVELVLGSAGSNRIRSALLQTIVAVVDHGMRAGEAVAAPRVHFEDGMVFTEPAIDTGPLEAAGRTVVRFRSPNLFFGGVQAVERDVRTGELSGGGDPRRGGAAVLVGE
jgi:gamma-glutamyltranspeptidase / glutathione hydrolase